MKTLLLALSSTFLLGGASFAKPEIVAPETVLLEGLKLIRDNKFEDWKKHCSTEKLCMNENSWKSLKNYNLTAMQRRAAKCVKDAPLRITRTDEISPTEKKIFWQCEESAMPIPTRMGLENDRWVFLSI